MISACNLSKSFGKKTVVDNVNFELEQGCILGLLGPNGAGKTTTLKMITNLCVKDRGDVTINGYSLTKQPREALLQVGAALDTPAFYNELTARENLEYVAKLYGNIPAARIGELIEFVGLGGQAMKRVKAYSLGMRQRLALARALVSAPQIVILDEPANGLDPQGMIQLYELIRHLAQDEKVTFIVSSHLLHDMENLCTDVLILHQGKSILQGKTVELTAGESGIVEIVLEDAEKGIRLIKETGGLELLRKQERCLTLRLTDCPVDGLIKRVVQSNNRIDFISMRKKSLEDLFLELTGGGIR
jgi:ABC-2 type transport system ATP-binding protein